MATIVDIQSFCKCTTFSKLLEFFRDPFFISEINLDLKINSFGKKDYLPKNSCNFFVDVSILKYINDSQEKRERDGIIFPSQILRPTAQENSVIWCFQFITDLPIIRIFNRNAFSYRTVCYSIVLLLFH